MAAQELSSPRSDPTARVALATVERGEQGSRLHATIEERCGDMLIEAFRRVSEAYYSGRDA